MKIQNIFAREVLDSRGNPTVEVDVHTKDHLAREMVPSGASTGVHEAIELRDGGKRYLGKGVQQAIRHVNDVIAPKLAGMDCMDQQEIDQLMLDLDGTANKSKLGANAILGVSLAVARCASLHSNLHFYEYLGQLAKNKRFVVPVPFMNVINGGAHADNELMLQEFMIVPHAECYRDSLRMASETYHTLGKTIKRKIGPFNTNIGDEGGYTPKIRTARQALDLIMDATEELGYENEIKIAIDAAASYFYEKDNYCIEEKCYVDGNALTDFYMDLMKEYPIVSIEDAFHEEAFDEFANLLKKVKGKMRVVGDDLTVTNVERIKKAITAKSCDTLLLKVNQIGTLTEAINAATLALKNGWKVMVSHRSGETENHFISDFAVGLGTGAIKSGATARGERTAKYNQLLRIEERLGVCFPTKVFGDEIRTG